MNWLTVRGYRSTDGFGASGIWTGRASAWEHSRMSAEIPRQRVLAAAGWGVPVVAAAVALPAAAASTGSITAAFGAPAPGNGPRTVVATVANTTESVSDAPVTVYVNAPGASQVMTWRAAPGWTVTASGNTVVFTTQTGLPALSSTAMEIDLLVDSEDDLLLIGELTVGGSVRHPFSLSR